MSAETYTAFAGHRRIAAGDLDQVARDVASLGQVDQLILIFDDSTGQPVDLDLRHGPDHATAEYRGRRQPDAPRRGRGRPKLGVVAREVTLLARHWEWLSAQPGGASATLRRLVEDARRSGPARARQARDALYRAMSALAGDLEGFEEAARALFAGDDVRFDALVTAWPADVAVYVMRLASVEREARRPV